METKIEIPRVRRPVKNFKPKTTPVQRVVLKFLYMLTRLNYPKLDTELAYFVRDGYYCRLIQALYVVHDYVIKSPYKVISYHGEFDQELRYVLPFAYWHHLNGTLKKTISAQQTKELYFFSANHEERFQKRVWTESYEYSNVSNMTHSNSYNFRNWAQVPLKSQYKNDLFVFDKPTLIIANKYNIEWEQPPINFLDIPALDRIISTYGHKYQIIYNRPLPTQIIEDNSDTLSLNEHRWLRETHPDVILMDDLYTKYYPTVVNNYNHLQLMVYANCDRFISMHGGTAAFASYFGGINILLSNPNWGNEYGLNEYENLFPKLSGATILHAHNQEEIFTYLSKHF